ncbi:hypothetical protein BAUCODRAFT_37538 [Baudoinia panamericana UAMH 10762]|uniref:RCC1-like domain-containing protein n=1 Tax=Baudoinia panamericana (strain UAMH 10762) TaxID=717646 RepID=M2N143_BAUPA|nr:uncharacterized protein BAUCODRAFT_37538 [Baudoinia panamericana UAMH 10762]EMC92644.1 hypothetical protein BAUCODRAFT_37538 [Baudoinia panamericana UAMH 10762]
MSFYALGSNGAGQLCLGHIQDLSVPTLFPAHSRTPIKQIACGGNHTILLYASGTTEGYGDNAQAQCGYPTSFEALDKIKGGHPLFVQHSADEVRQRLHVKQVSATWKASICLCSDGRVKVCGEGLHGELGLGEGRTDSLNPCAIEEFPPMGTEVVQIASGMAHTVAVMSNGDVWGWGKGGQGQLGEPAKDVWSPRKIEGLPFGVAKAVCGKDFTFVVGTRASGKLRVIGLNKRDRFGLKTNLPSAVSGWKDIAASWGSVFILGEHGKLRGFGRDDHGQLPPSDLPFVEAIAAGSEHCLALTKGGKVLAWGWGEHGNCGEPTDERGDVSGHFNVLDVLEPIGGLFAGCATSFITTHDAELQSGRYG